MTTLTRHAIRNAAATALYIAGIATFTQNVPRFIGETPGVVGAVAFILTFVTSALITGGLVLWEPIQLLLDGKRRDALRQLVTTGVSLVIILALIFAGLALR